MNRFLICISVLALIVGCRATSDRLASGETPSSALAAGNGVVIVSTGAASKCVSQATFLKVLRDGTDYFGAELDLLGVDGFASKSDFPTHQGNVYVLALPPGRYYLAQWWANPYITPKQVPSYEFAVTAGQIAYLGEFYMPVHCGLWTDVRISNQFERDLAVVKLRYPGLDAGQVGTTLITRGGWAVGP